MEELQYVSLLLANHRESQTALSVETSSLDLRPLTSPQEPPHPDGTGGGVWVLQTDGERVGREGDGQEANFPLTNVWFLFSEALKGGSVKKK